MTASDQSPESPPGRWGFPVERDPADGDAMTPADTDAVAQPDGGPVGTAAGAGGWITPRRAADDEPVSWPGHAPSGPGNWEQPETPPFSGMRPQRPAAPEPASPFPYSPAPAAPPVGPAFAPTVTAALAPTAAVGVAPTTDATPDRVPSWADDVAAGIALAVEVGVALLMLSAFITGTTARSFVGSAVVTEYRSFRFRLLSVFAPASFNQAVIVLLGLLLMVTVPATRASKLRRPAMAIAAGLGIYIAAGAVLRTVALMTFLGAAPALAVGSTLASIAAIPVGAAASIWSAVLLARDDARRRTQA